MGTVITRLSFLATLVISSSAPAYFQASRGSGPPHVLAPPGPDQKRCWVLSQPSDYTLLPKQLSFKEDVEAAKVLRRVLEAAGHYATELTSEPADVETALYCDSERTDHKYYLLYNREWFRKLYKTSTEKWADLTIFAHEVGHYVHHDSQNPRSDRTDLELSADQFAGSVLFNMGALWPEVKAVYMSHEMASKLPSDHASTPERVERARIGWQSAQNNAAAAAAEYKKGMESLSRGSYTEARDAFILALLPFGNSTTCLRESATMVSLAEAYLGLGDFTNSIRNLTTVMKKCDGLEDLSNLATVPAIHERALARRAEVYILGAEGDADEREYYLQKALEDYPLFLARKSCANGQKCEVECIALYLARADINIQLERYTDAIQAYSKAIGVNDQITARGAEPIDKKDLANIYSLRSIAYRAINQPDAADADKKKALEIRSLP